MVMLGSGIAAILVGIGVAMLIDGNALLVLLSASSFILVFTTTMGAGVMAYGPSELKGLLPVLKVALRNEPAKLDETVTVLAQLADVARREGMLSLESRLEEVEDDGIRHALQLVIDGLDPEQVKELIDIDLEAVEQRHAFGINFFQSLGGYAPTFGMVGTVIGLINMLQNLTSPEQLGVGMALALLTTLYGVILANVVFTPLATRLQRLSASELAVREAALDGVLAIQSGISPRMLVERLETFLPKEERVGYRERSQRPTNAESPKAA